MSTENAPKIAIILYDGMWFIRRVAYTVQDDVRGEMVYHCDEHIGGPFVSWHDMQNAADAYIISCT